MVPEDARAEGCDEFLDMSEKVEKQKIPNRKNESAMEWFGLKDDQIRARLTEREIKAADRVIRALKALPTSLSVEIMRKHAFVRVRIGGGFCAVVAKLEKPSLYDGC